MAQNGDLLFGAEAFGAKAGGAETGGAEAGGGGPVAQLVEHRTFNAVVPGSSPGRLTRYHKIRFRLRSSRILERSGSCSELR
jgi:hypothetical protein